MNYVLTPNAVNKIRRAIAPRSGNGGAVAARGLSIDLDKFPPPFTVRWSQSENSGVGAWVIWLPDPSQLVIRGESYIDDIDGVTASDILPEGWYTIDDLQNDSESGVESGGESGGEGETETGSVYLVVRIDGNTATAALSGEAGQPTSGESVVNLLIAETSANIVTGIRLVKQYVTSSVLIATQDNEDHDTHYYADDKSIENAKFSGSGSSHVVESNTFALKGFGRFDRDQTGEAGIFVGSTELELGSEAMTGASVLVRQGDTDTVNGNTLGFVRLKLPEGSNAATPFQYVEVPDPEQEGQTLFKIVNCFFYFGGQPHTLPDFANIPATGTVYLTCVKESSQASSWQFAVAAAPAQAPSGGSAINIKLYDFQNGKVTMDYRTTFLTLGEGGNTVEPDDVSTEFIPDAPSGTTPTGDEGKLQIKGFNSGTPSDTNNIAQYLQGAAQLPSSGLFLVARVGASAGGSPTLKYIPLSTIFTNQSGDLSVEFVADNDWDSTNHILRKRLRVLNLRTGAVTDKANTTYANGWEVMAQTTGITTILPQQSGSGNS